MIDLEKKYQDSPELSALAKEILERYPGHEFDPAKDHSWRIMFVNKSLSEYGGKCRKIDGALRFHTRFEFLILIWRQEFEKLSDKGKLRLLCHELFHIGESDEGAPRLRKHSGDFCEIPSHDSYSMNLAAKLQGNIVGLKNFPQQTELAPKIESGV